MSTIAGLLSGIFLISSWITPISIILRPIFFIIDSMIYSVVPVVYHLCKLIAGVQFIINQQAVLDSVSKGIYSLLAIVMLFKLAFSLLVLMTDPDKIEDKEKGAAKIFTNVIVCLILIIVVPMIFKGAASLQDALLGIKRNDQGVITTNNETGIIDKIFNVNNIEGKGGCLRSRTTDELVCPDIGSFLSESVFQVFFTFTPNTLADLGSQKVLDLLGHQDIREIKDIYDETFMLPFPYFFRLMPYINAETLYTVEVDNIPIIGTQNVPSGTIYVFGYFFLFSTAAGLYLLWTFISLALDIGYRSIKLFALQLIAPIPIISYVDSNSQTKGMFKKWTDEVVKTYLSLFIRLAVLSIAGIIIKSVDWNAPAYTGGDLQNLWSLLIPFTKIFFFFGILTFMKTAPKMFENIFGYSAKTKEESFGQNLIKGLMGGGAAAAVGAVSGGISSKMHGYGFTKGAALGGLKGLTEGAKAGYSGKGYGKALIAGAGDVAKTFGYKGFIENQKAGFKDKAEQNAIKGDFNKFNVAAKYDKDDMVTGFKDLYTKGVREFERADATMIGKAAAKRKGWAGAITGEGGRLAGDAAYKSTMEQLWRRKSRDAERAVTLARGSTEAEAAKVRAKAISNAYQMAEKESNDAKAALKNFMDRPTNTVAKEKYDRIKWAEDSGAKEYTISDYNNKIIPEWDYSVNNGTKEDAWESAWEKLKGNLGSDAIDVDPYVNGKSTGGPTGGGPTGGGPTGGGPTGGGPAGGGGPTP